MTSLEFIDDCAKAYAYVWTHRAFLLRAAAAAIFLKTLSLLLIIVTLPQPHPLREGLILLPAYVLEGLFLTGLIRFYLYQEPLHAYLPMTRKRANDLVDAAKKSHYTTALQYGIAVYLLTKVVLGFIAGVLSINIAQDPKEILGEPNIGLAIISLGFLAIIFWSVRLLWLFVPATMGIPLGLFLKKIAGLQQSLYFIGAFIIGTVPLIFLYALISNISAAILGINNPVHIVFTAFLQSATLLSCLVIQTIAIAHGIHTLFHGKKTP